MDRNNYSSLLENLPLKLIQDKNCTIYIYSHPITLFSIEYMNCNFGQFFVIVFLSLWPTGSLAHRNKSLIHVQGTLHYILVVTGTLLLTDCTHNKDAPFTNKLLNFCFILLILGHMPAKLPSSLLFPLVRPLKNVPAPSQTFMFL